MKFSLVLIPADESMPLKPNSVVLNNGDEGDVLASIQPMLLLSESRENTFEHFSLDNNRCGDPIEIPLLRPLRDSPGLYAYYLGDPSTSSPAQPNIRATRLAMACGLLPMRFSGNIVVARSHPTQSPRWHNLTMEEILGACEVSPDLRQNVQNELVSSRRGRSCPIDAAAVRIPAWLANAAQQNYHDAAAVSRMAEVMKHDKVVHEGDHDTGTDSGTTNTNTNKEVEEEHDSDEGRDNQRLHRANQQSLNSLMPAEFVAKSPLCLHCRRPTRNLCQDCQAAYFCPPPRDCRTMGWSHSCQCQTWKLYTSHRKDLSTFDYLDPEWLSMLMGRDFQTSEEPYRKFLAQRIGIDFDELYGDTADAVDPSPCKASWWGTETDGWAGGHSASACRVDPTIRQSYQAGFAPLPSDQVPRQERPSVQDYQRAGGIQTKNNVGLWRLCSWEDYYKFRGIPSSSPVALLFTFPLTIYRAIEQYGEVPVTVAQMLKRPLRIHVVGAEKEMNFIDLFNEVGFLLPEELLVELVFVVRQDMLPSHCQPKARDSSFSFKVRLTSNLTVTVVSGTYGTAADLTCLDPSFDVGSGPPDMVLALNAGLYAYESWRSVVEYLDHNPGVVGVFTDYNEYSGMNCASLGGAASRESLAINPFRQPLALPVYSMNLPQFSNGFFYVFNPQELE